MNEIIAILSTLSPHLNPRTLNRLAIIVKTNLKTGGTAKVLLFSDDLALAGETLIEYYSF